MVADISDRAQAEQAVQYVIDALGHLDTLVNNGTFAQSRGPEFGRDFQSTYFEDWLTLIGITDITRTRVQPTILSPTLTEQLLAASRWSAEAGAAF